MARWKKAEVMGRPLLQVARLGGAPLLGEAERKVRRCSDCVHLAGHQPVDTNGYVMDEEGLECAANRWAWRQDDADVFDLVALLRTAASCPDFTPAPEDQPCDG